ncbi:hypothetical protein BG261_09780 [Floricoccus tropicus]|uniref:Uncharacterized protein n=1 Tax=Floricoccus tropicus TaxID=1859473 RepID=A0A1E8GNS8_9LACT|nr:hypothetical protein [Floricoccus tropicus]OFI49924.1 hypothetical protein BG261_09780 [Floricoccus tropicus]
MKIKFKNVIVYTICYFLAVLAVVIISNNYYIASDTDNLVNEAYKVDKDLTNGKPIRFDDIKVETFTKDQTSDKDIAILKDGAATSRVIKKDTISVAIPRYVDNQIIGYLRITDKKTDDSFIITLFVIFALIIYLVWLLQFYLRYTKSKEYMENLVAKIKAISRNPLEQSYLITDETDPITKELNKLGEKIQHQAISTRPKKENLYEFIEFFDFPIFIYNGKGSIKRYNEAFKGDFSAGESLDMFSQDADFLTFLVSKLVDPELDAKEFHFDHKKSDYIVHLQPIPDLTDNILVTMQEVTSLKNN